MIREQLLNNLKAKSNTREVNKLRADFPQFFDNNGKFLINRFSEMLQSEYVDVEKEGYELKFLGKSYAKYLTSTDTETVITPDEGHNSKEINKNSENVYIVGDNLDAIKHLLQSYSGQVKCIYIDPPYNTGSDGFIYPDNFQFTKENLAETIGIELDEAERIIEIAGKSTHSAWLMFMYPRLMLARDLLKEDGVIFISIDDNEQSNLKLLCDEIFGEINFLANLIWEKKYTIANDAQFFSDNHDHILCYSKNIDVFKIGRLPRTEKMDKAYSNPDNHPNGPWKATPLHAKSGSENSADFTYTFNNGVTFKPPQGTYARFSSETLAKFDENKEIWFGKNGDAIPSRKTFLSQLKSEGIVPRTIIGYKEGGHNHEAVEELKDLFGFSPFNDPKPTKLILHLMKIANLNRDSIIMDFFSGSATTAHSVMKLNAEDNGDRKYILIQLPEKIKESKSLNKAIYRTIDEIGRFRIEKAAIKIKSETGSDIDYGFKLYRLNEPDKNRLDKIVEFDPHSTYIMEDMTEGFSFDEASGRATILTTWINQDGYGLICQTEKVKLNTYTVDLCQDSLYIIDPGITSEDVMDLIKMVEDNTLNISRIVIYPYSLTFNVLHELKKNFLNLRNSKNVNVIERY
ncbi:site-specific DNA-methyltransferase [Acetobacterium paludosum]|uniref:Site-specific DNA-methyltransferase n=1 Tax=Acetobacterium paludosum TaxID=52693 RepID=A0A923HSQ6_9FIRM|nr:site-specific DNA-methyltransferase [Acetobacterium paludosum]MBC3887984.1 site-specific DNA-methyltransferase [Acetobacterium paludosum]